MKATIAGCDCKLAEKVLKYASEHNYLLTVDEEATLVALVSTHPGRELAGDFSLLRLLVKAEVSYAIKVTEYNKDALKAKVADASTKAKKQTSDLHETESPDRPRSS